MTRNGRPRAASQLTSVKEAGTRLGMGRTRLTALLDQGDLVSIKIGSRRLILVASLEDFAERQHERAERDGRVRVPPQVAESVIP